ncbi:alpha/beta hydrolase family protein [Streptomyces gibsoniae]|uniref:Lipase n=1 Tax=Streptomyces gibsoniae TaxID=3075529 RepID=A0ABU2U6I7_9ACTN|nr:lipase [Streptomyces sp. DSM 41699]MDT0468848.1 lipase [Streptomyces sp. DSM 41699]
MPPVRPNRRSLIAGGLAVAAAAAVPPSVSTPAVADGLIPIRLAGPTGPAPVGAVDLHLVDPSRTDPWSGQAREVMVTVTYPAADVRDRAMLPWLPAGAERALKARFGGAVDGYALPETHSADRAPVRPGRRPVLLHSPGYQSDRTFNTLLIEELASRGYVVAAVDHPYDSGEVEFPGGRVVVNRPDDASDEARTAAVAVRAADLRFVLDQLTVLERGGNPDTEGRPLPRGLRGTLDLTRVGVFGHSRGGAASASVMHLDERVRAGIDLDGALYGPVVEHGLGRPFLLMDTAVHDGLNQDGSWPPFWAHLSDWHRCLRLADADHNCFTDIVAIAPQIPESVRRTLQIGTIPADRAVAAVRATVRDFFDLQLRGRQDAGHLLWGASPRYPEIEYIAG